jgi:hypothetical protein
LQKLGEIVRAARLRADPRHFEATERLPTDHRPGATTVNVEVADPEGVDGTFDICRRATEYSAGECVDRIISEFKRVGEVACTATPDHWAEYLFTPHRTRRINVTKYSWGDEKALCRDLSFESQFR